MKLKTEIAKFLLKQAKRYKVGKTNLVQKDFLFSDNIGFLHSFEEIFEEEVYRFVSKKNEPLIIDCGSNIGLSIAYFKKLYPKSHVIGFEPDKKIFSLLKENIKQYNNVEIHNAAAWVANTELNFFEEGSLAGSTTIDFAKKNKTNKIKAVDLNFFLDQEIDFLKIDIEGAENELIFHIKENLKNVRNLFLEYHELKDNQQNLSEILTILKNAGLNYYIRNAADTMQFPYCDESPRNFLQQLNIFCFRR